ncbi:MFS transporter [Amycolatopsis sp. NPDC051903]|uniref:MFS transporter n=1 Tax=Amycolatopsis sp. NPDC051903 TaxID=3363936 RepID=UPI003796E00D
MHVTALPAERAVTPFVRPRASNTTGFWTVAASFTALMAFATVTAPLWSLYQQRDQFSATTVTAAFAAMVMGTAAGFTLLGHLSDRFGRRAVVMSGLLVGVAGAGVMAASATLAVLITGRVLTGLAVGMVASTATAYLGELHVRAGHTAVGSAFPGLVATTANLGGLALGPITGGVLATWAPLPLHVSYLVFAGVMAALAVVVAFAPETVDVSAHSEGRPVRFALLPGARASFTGAAAVGFFALALLGLFSSLGGVIVRAQLHTASILVVGLVPFTAFAVSAVAQIALRRLTHIRLLTAGSALFPIGLALTTLSLYEPHLWLLLVAAGLAGGGAGLLFKGAVTETVRLARPASRAGVLAMFFAIAYLGMGLPSIVLSLVIQRTALRPAMIGFASVLAIGAVAAVVTAARTHRRVWFPERTPAAPNSRRTEKAMPHSQSDYHPPGHAKPP